MLISKILCSLLLVCALSAHAEDSYESSFEDTTEFLAPLAPEPVTQSETWAYGFVLIKPNGSTRTLTSQNLNLMLKPASTLKLFTGWWSFQRETRTDAYLAIMLRESVNTMADDTQQRMGGIFAMEDNYREWGIDLTTANFKAADGSGLSYDNFTTCGVQISLLKKIKGSKTYTRFKKLLAQPKIKGTLKTRLTGFSGLVFAKTGTLAKTASLSGFLETKRGTVAFCVMGDYLSTSLVNARKKIDKMVRTNYYLVK